MLRTKSQRGMTAVLAAVCSCVFGADLFGQQRVVLMEPAVEIDLRPGSLPRFSGPEETGSSNGEPEVLNWSWRTGGVRVDAGAIRDLAELLTEVEDPLAGTAEQMRRRERGQEVRFELPEGVTIDGRADWTSRDGGYLHVAGMFDGADAPGTWTLSLDGDQVRATLVTLQGRFLIWPDAGSTHTVVRTGGAPISNDIPEPVFPVPDVRDRSQQGGVLQSWQEIDLNITLDNPARVSVMVVTSHQANAFWTDAGRTPLLEALHWVVRTNHAFYLGGIPVRLRLAHWEPTAFNGYQFVEEQLGPAIVDLTTANGAWAQKIHASRNRYAADLVQMVIHVPGVLNGGIANIPQLDTALGFPCSYQPINGFCPDLGFSVTGAWAHDHVDLFAHEIGHNFGLWHDRFTIVFQTDGDPGILGETSRIAVTPDAYGYVNRQAVRPGGAPRAQRWRTIMSYDVECEAAQLPAFDLPHTFFGDRCTQLPWWSTHTGGNAGSIGGPANAARALSQAAPYVAAYR